MEYTLCKEVRDNQKVRRSFDQLARDTFGLSFEAWFRARYWTDRYTPYALLDGERVVANVSVNRMDTRWKGRPRRYIQLGTVMTHPSYRNRGLCRYLMERVMEDWRDRCDGMYLFANGSVLGFYPKFGFERAHEYQHRIPILPRPHTADRLNLDWAESRELLSRCYQKGNPFSKLPMVDNYGLLMFYCTSIFKDCVYYVRDLDAVVIVRQEEGQFTCLDIYCGRQADMVDVLGAAVPEGTTQVSLGFTPLDTVGCTASPIEGDDYLFLLAGKKSPFEEERLMFPLLSHA